jgi:multidrug efflux pump subunit AcrA (membrane-fusion protein)
MHDGAPVPDSASRLSPTRRHSLGILASSLAAFALLLGGCRPSPDGKAPTKPAAAAVPVTVAHPVSRQVEDWNEFIGRLAAPETVEIRSRVSGYLAKVHFQEGSLVQPSDLLVTIDPRPYQAVVDRPRRRSEPGQASRRPRRRGSQPGRLPVPHPRHFCR